MTGDLDRRTRQRIASESYRADRRAKAKTARERFDVELDLLRSTVRKRLRGGRLTAEGAEAIWDAGAALLRKLSDRL